EKVPSVATFYGAHYLSYDLSDRGDPILSSNDRLSLFFKTRQSNGLLFYTGDEGDYMNVAIKDGGLVLTINLGSGVYDKVIRPKDGNSRFDDNRWHKLVIIRESREVTIEVDNKKVGSGTTTGDFTMLSSNVLYVGGSPDTSKLPGSRVKSNFRGCLKKVEYQADSIHLRLIELARNKHNLMVTHGDIMYDKCESLVESQPITFLTPDSFIKVPKWEATQHGTIEFQFQTTEPNGLLMYNNGAETRSDFFALELLDGQLYMIMDLGSGAIKERVSKQKIADGAPHKVKVDHHGTAGIFTVDTKQKPYKMPPGSERLDLDGSLYIGGINSRTDAYLLPRELWSGMLGFGYVGCMEDLTINGERVDLSQLSREQEVYGIGEYCRKMEPQCTSRPCMHHGICREGWNRFICDCAATAFTGPSCEEGAATLAFDGTQYMKLTMPEESKTEAEDISIRFRTKRENGLIFATTSVKSKDRMELAVYKGTIRLDINLGSGSKTMETGANLNDDKWHTVRIRRRSKSVHLKVDNGQPVKDKLSGKRQALQVNFIHLGSIVLIPKDSMQGDSSIMEFQDIDVAIKRKDDGRSRSNFVGQMSQFTFNGNQFFEMAMSGEVTNIEVTATFDKMEKLIQNPVTFKSSHAYAMLPRLNAYSTFNLFFQLKTTEPDGLVMFNKGEGGDFIALEMVKGNLHFVYDVGSGPHVIISDNPKKLNDNKWHDIAVLRPTLNQHILRVDGKSRVDHLGDSKEVHYDLLEPLYLGGLSKLLFNSLPKLMASRFGFQGCMASFDLNGIRPRVVEDRDVTIPGEYLDLISSGCNGPTVTCNKDACDHGGRCVQAWNKYTCDCDMTSFSGDTCSEESTSYQFGEKGGLITLTYPEGERPHMKHDQIALGLVTTQKDCIILRIDSDRSNDYIEMELVDGQLFVVYNMGSYDHPIGEFSTRINDGQYHIIRFARSGANSTIQVDNHDRLFKYPEGKQLNIFNYQAFLQVGGKIPKHHRVHRGKRQVERHFEGIIAGLFINGLSVLDLADSDDPRTRIQGDVSKLDSLSEHLVGLTTRPPTKPVVEKPGKDTTPPMQSTMGLKATDRPDPVTDDIISSGVRPCHDADDDDDCDTQASGTDLLITPHVKWLTTPAPPVTTTTTTTTADTSFTGPCDDDEDCDWSGSGTENPEVSTNTDDIYITSTDPRVIKIPGGNSSKYPYTGDTPSETTDIVIIVNMTDETSKKHNGITQNPTIVTSMGGKTDGGTKTVTGERGSLLDGSSINIWLIIGICVGGFVFLMLIVAFIMYKLKTKDKGSYKIDESKNYSTLQPEKLSNGGTKNALTSKPNGKKKAVKEWYV
ncbi:unnamed protein product, partial [Owenia fusiformis]